MSHWVNLQGKRFGMLIVQGIAGRTPQGKLRWACVCDCGKTTVVNAADLCKPGRGTKSCGCQIGQARGAQMRTHGMTRHPAYAVWRSMLARCLHPQHYAFHNYGGRGIGVCARWQESFENFWEDMGPTYVSGLCLDRVDNNGNYKPENCRWTTYVVQAGNRRNARFVKFKGERLNVSEAARRSGIGVTTLLYRLAQGWSEENLFIIADFHNRVSK